MVDKDFEYKVSIIVPIYNAQDHLRKCLDSLWLQTINSNQMEVLLINDGSSDGSEDICIEYVESCPIFKYVFQENAGPSSARNTGIFMAKGKYIMFLDADDTFNKDTVELVTKFFDKNYDEIDLVSCYDQYYQNGKKLPPHARYHYLKETGIYDLNQFPYCMQMRLSICTKNLFENNILFDVNMFYQEDQKYCTQILSEKMKLGFVKEAVYNYNKHEDSIVGASTNPIIMFEQDTNMFEDMFQSYDVVPKYCQALFFHDLQWKFSSSCLYPYHYKPQELEQAKNRIKALLRKVDNDIIMSSNEIDNYQKLYWIRQKEDGKLTPVLNNNNLMMLHSGNVLYSRKDVEIILKRIRIDRNGIAKIVAYFKSPFFSLCDNCKFYVERNGIIEDLDVCIASNSYYKAKERTDRFWAFSYEIKITGQEDIRFFAEIDNIMYHTSYWIDSKVPFSGASNRKMFAVNGCQVNLIENSIISFKRIDDSLCDQIIADYTGTLKDTLIKKMRENYLENKNHRVWLYIDNYAVEYDNGWMQFLHDIKKNDGIERYYILTNHNIEKYFDLKEYKNIVPFGSNLHKILLLRAEKLLTAFVENEVCFPFSSKEISQLNDLLNVEVIYLQHGVLHAHLPWYYSPTNVTVDKEVVSTEFEIENLSTNYGFKKSNLIPVGMPRFKWINKMAEAENLILFAPSWRSYLIGEIKSGGEVRDGNSKKLFDSNYFKNIMQFVQSPELHKMLEDHDMILHLKLHPEFMNTYGSDITLDLPRIKFLNERVDVTKYKVFITDFSSFVFDFAYLNRPIMYFVPDYQEFCAGVNRYRELDLPFEDAFGPLSTSVSEALQDLEKILDSNCTLEEKYAKRLDNFYLPMGDTTENLYNYLVLSD